MKTSTRVLKKIEAYNPDGQIDQTARLVLSMLEVSQPKTKTHSENVALLAEALAIKLKRDAKAAFFGGLLHDFGKLLLPGYLFDGRNITPEEYDQIKQHVSLAFEVLQGSHLLTAYCAGLHHDLSQGGYGLKLEDFPKWMSLPLVKKIMDTAVMVSICDYIEAATHRNSKVIGVGAAGNGNLKTMLAKKYPDDQYIVKTALKISRELKI